jgi:hypothetical protein
MSTAFKCLAAVTILGFLMGWSLFLRMAIELNKVLPPRKRILLIELREHISEVNRLYMESFPSSTLPTMWRVLTTISALVLASAVMIEIAK